MRRTLLILLLLVATVAAALAPAQRWIDIIFLHRDGISRTVRSLSADSLATAGHIAGESGRMDSLRITAPGGTHFSFALDSMERCELRKHIPVIYIDTDSAVYEITSKKEYLTGRFSMSAGAGTDADFDSITPVDVNIRGRGNSTWSMPKKPYRLKFNKKISLCGMAKAKNYALIANYIDPTLMHNTAALAIAQGLGMPYTNHSVAVDVVLNGRYCGSYMLTEKIGINSGSVDIDEDKGLLLEMDVAMDEDYCFHSPLLRLPVMIKDPDLQELAEADTSMTADARFDTIKADFARAEAALFSSDTEEWRQYFDLNSVVNYLLVQNISGNWEFSHPKSLYLYQTQRGEPYHFGPVWDFDWTAEYFLVYEAHYDYGYPLLINTLGSEMFMQMTRSEIFWEHYRERWQYFKRTVWPQVKTYLEAYAVLLETSALRNGELWHPQREDRHEFYWESTAMFSRSLNRYLDWLERRIEYIDQSPAMGLYW